MKPHRALYPKPSDLVNELIRWNYIPQPSQTERRILEEALAFAQVAELESFDRSIKSAAWNFLQKIARFGLSPRGAWTIVRVFLYANGIDIRAFGDAEAKLIEDTFKGSGSFEDFVEVVDDLVGSK